MDPTEELTPDQKLGLMDIAIRLRSSAPMGAVGLLEVRNLFSNLFPEFAEVRDSDLDDDISAYAQRLAEMPEYPEQGPLDDDSDRLS